MEVCRPYTQRIDSRLIRSKVDPAPHDQPCTVRFRRYSIRIAKENHFIGGARTRIVEHYDGLSEIVARPVGEGPAVFQTESACRGAIRRVLTEVLPPLIQYYYVDSTEWDEFEPAGLVERIVAGAVSKGWRNYYCDVWMHVEVTRVCSEAEEVLRLCEAAAADVAPPSGSVPGAGDACPICMEELAKGATGLLDCSHAFHRECILKWFDKKQTCPCCRRDNTHYLHLIRRPART